MPFSYIGGLAALTCATTYLVGFALLLTLLAPLGYGTGDIDAVAVVAFNDANPGILFVWNSIIYIVNALALVVLVAALATRLAGTMPGWGAVTQGLGLIWAALVLGAGMIANVAVEQAARLFPTDPAAAAAQWKTLHAVELGLGGGNEIAGGVWIGCVCVAGLLSGTLPRPVAGVGLLAGLGGLATVIPAVGDPAGAVFGLGAILWFLLVGATLMTSPTEAPTRGGRE